MQSKKKNSIMQLLELYNQDTRVDKVNLTAGIYTDESGNCPILESVREAEYYRIKNQINKASFNLTGATEFHKAVRTILFPTIEDSIENDKIQVIQTLGASGALHLAGQLINQYNPSARIWLSSPTWENHLALLSSHSGGFGSYRYQPANQEQLCIDTIIEDLQFASPGDFVLFHVCCHNPTGIDPNLSQWEILADFCAERKLIPLFDFAYQGFAHSLQQDAKPFTIFKERLDMFLICNSFSKNMGIYDERTGALTLVFKDTEKLKRWYKTVKELIRGSYSMPPVHGSFIVSHIINDSSRFDHWQREVEGMCKDLQQRRNSFFSELSNVGIIDEIMPYRKQNGMFLYLNLSEEKIESLRNKHGIYLLDSGRMCLASLSTANMSKVAEVIKRVI
ncbi:MULTISPECIES: aromatic amino acid transaminase [Bacillus cereus group]|uniref:aromatic amino acid transaminase n=1 Tax=Bacillus cereus group TaxID=86661 RepID=UPI0005CEFBAD|nr:aromatic amino acid transaminase [Bacillus thuringiensis]MBR9663091.1 aromatic amino acid transaminase [Bacillus cereus]